MHSPAVIETAPPHLKEKPSFDAACFTARLQRLSQSSNALFSVFLIKIFLVYVATVESTQMRKHLNLT